MKSTITPVLDTQARMLIQAGTTGNDLLVSMAEVMPGFKHLLDSAQRDGDRRHGTCNRVINRDCFALRGKPDLSMHGVLPSLRQYLFHVCR